MAALTDVITVEWAPTDDPFDTTPTWTDITDQVLSVNISRGRTGSFELYGAGQATITIENTAATIDPTVWYRWRQIRVTATATGPTTNTLFYGFVQQITHDQSTAPFQGLAVIRAEDVLSLLARYEYNASSVPEELSGARIERVADAVSLPSAWRDFDTGFVYIAEPVGNLFGVQTDGLITTNALTHLQDVAESEVGGLYVSAAGVLTFEDRYQLRSRLDGASEETFSDTASGAELPYMYGDLKLTPPGTDYRNSVTFVPDSGDAQTASNVPANFPTDSLSRTHPIRYETQAMANSEMLLEVYRQQNVTWPVQITVHMWPDAQATLDAVSALELRRYCVVEATPTGASQQTYNVVTEALEHRIGYGEWKTTIGFSSGDRWIDGWITGKTFLVLDDGTAGQLNQEVLGF